MTRYIVAGKESEVKSCGLKVEWEEKKKPAPIETKGATLVEVEERLGIVSEWTNWETRCGPWW